MADDILHIKDSYYFEVPRFLWPSHRKSAGEFPSWMVRLDDDYQQWEGAWELWNGVAISMTPSPFGRHAKALTDMAAAFTKGVPQADGSLRAEPVMDVRLVADAVLQMARLPLDVSVPFMTIMARDMPFLGRG